MSLDDHLGYRASLVIRRFGSPGAILALGEEQDILLLGSEIPLGAKEGDSVDVFVYRDSEGRPLATTRSPKIERGQVAFLEVVQRVEFGAFVDWGLARDLLVPYAEQTADLHVGSRYAIGLYVDDTGRLAGTMKVSEMLDTQRAQWVEDEWVQGEAWRDDPTIGLFVIVERHWVGLVPKDEHHGLARGEAARFRISNLLPNGKIELSLRGHAHEELENDARRVLEVLQRDATPMSDKSSPETIRSVFGLSKKAFKRAVGRLLKEGAVASDSKGILRVKAPPRK